MVRSTGKLGDIREIGDLLWLFDSLFEEWRGRISLLGSDTALS
jgi:hypothetical protein